MFRVGTGMRALTLSHPSGVATSGQVTLIRDVDVAVAENGEQDVVGTEIVGDLDGLGKQDGGRRLGDF